MTTLDDKALEQAWEAAARTNMTEDSFGPTEWLLPEVKDRWRRISRAAITAYLAALKPSDPGNTQSDRSPDTVQAEGDDHHERTSK